MTPSSQAARDTATRFFAALNQGDLDAVEALVADEFVGTVPVSPDPIRGPKGLRGFSAMLLAAFPDLQIEVEEIVAEDNTVAVLVRAQGTHRGEFAGMPPTGTHAMWNVTHFMQLRDQQLCSDRMFPDVAAIMRQLGSAPGA